MYVCRRDHRHDEHSAHLHYLLFTPPGINGESERLPLIVFLHGRGERAQDQASEDALAKVKTTGLPLLASTDRLPKTGGAGFPMLVAAPQAAGYWNPHTEQGHIVDLVDELIRDHNADPNRCYLTGLSMGAFACWEIAARAPGRFAAMVPVSGGIPPAAVSAGDTPVWVFTGGRDGHYPADQVGSAVEKLRSNGGDITLTVEPDAGHNQPFWNDIYGRSDLYEWLLAHSRETAGRQTGGIGD
jgi:predicted peptidase